MLIIKILLGLVVVFLLLYGVIFLYDIRRITRHYLRRSPSSDFVERDAVPEAELSKLERAEAFLLGAGFVYRFTLRVSPLPRDVPGPDAMYMDVYHHVESDAYAVASYQPVLAGHHIGYSSYFTDGGHCTTYNRFRHQTTAFDDPNVFDDCLPDDAAAWDAHLRRLSASGRQTARDEALCRQSLWAHNVELIDRLLERGAIKPSDREERWHFTWPFAFRWGMAMLKGARRAAKSPKSSEVVAPEKREAMEIDSFLWHREILRQPPSRYKGMLFIATAVLFLLVVAWYSDWTVSCAIFFVVALHEGGHWLAMRLLGYHNTSVFFIPGLGALTTGEKKNASPFQRLLVYFAGPMPGLILVGALYLITFLFTLTPLTMTALTSPMLSATVSTSFILFIFFLFYLNYLNLLPIPPLDGGRIVEILVFSRLPRARLAFSIVSCLIFLMIAYFQRNLLFTLFCFLLVLAIPAQWRLTRLRLAIGGNKTEQSEEEAIGRIFRALQLPQFAKWPLRRRIDVAKALIPEYIARQPRAWDIIVGLVIYLFCLVLPVLFICFLWRSS